MNLSEIIKDAVTYPTKNISALLVYLILGFLTGLVLVLTGMGGFVTGSFNFGAGVIVGIIGIIVVICLCLLMSGFSLDVIKLGINRSDDAPKIDFANQISNGFKYFIISVVYLIIPIIIAVILGRIISPWLGILIGFVLTIIFAFALVMAECRLAETGDLGYALNISGAISDIGEIGVGTVILTVIVSLIVGAVVVFIISFIVALILGIINIESLTSTITTIYSTVMDAWFLFYLNRVMGLLYSNKS